MSINNMSISKRLTLSFGLAVLAIIILSSVAFLSINSLSGEWHHFHDVSYEKLQAANEGHVKLGDAIHQFKNYLIRTQDYDQKFMGEMDGISKALASYTDNHGEMTERENQALNRVKEGIETYREAMRQAVAMKKAGTSIEEIDKSIKGADSAIASGFDELLAVTKDEIAAEGLHIDTAAQSGQQSIVVISLVVTLLAVVIGVWITRSILRQMGGEPAYVAEVVQRVADGDLTVRVETKASDNSSMLYGIKDMVNKIAGIVGEVRNSTDSITNASQEIAQGNADLSQRTEAQASSLEETASSMEELTSTVRQNAENARQANQLAVNASDIAVKGGQVVGEVVDTMASISTSSKKIVDIISVIDGIAFQTNILALNAAVEAARAGEQGRGFAVVAGEVRNLAQRSAAAAKEIKTLIDDSVNKVDAGSKQVDQAGATMQEIVQAVKRVTDIMSEIAAASNEQTAGIEQVNIAITQMDEVTQQNAALVEEAAAASESMQEQAGVLMQAVSIFKLEAGRTMTRATAQPVEQHAIAQKAAAHHPAAHAALAPAKSTRKLVNKAKADQDGDWKEF